jgi:aryl-alcohol dehydrogenase-like predicted oxidoreductase
MAEGGGNRSRIVLQTKVTTNFTKQHIQEGIDASLIRLQAEWIDLYHFHSFDAKTPLEEGLEALTRAVEQNKIRDVGCSNFNAVQLRESLAIAAVWVAAKEEVQPPTVWWRAGSSRTYYPCVPRRRSGLSVIVRWALDS